MFLVLLTILKLCPNVQDWGLEGQYYVSRNNMKINANKLLYPGLDQN